ncbi:hypothetical protein D3C72_1562450 [compost metagenome]
MVGTGHWRSVCVDSDHQVGAAQVAIVITGGETDILGHRRAIVFRWRVGERPRIHVDQQGAALDRLDVEGVGCRVERAAISTVGAVAALPAQGFGVIGIGGAVDQQRFDKTAVGAKQSAAHQAAGDGCSLHRTGQHLIQFVEVGDHHRIGVGMGTAVIGQRIEIAGVDAAAQTNGIRLDAVAVEEGLPGNLVGRADAL